MRAMLLERFGEPLVAAVRPTPEASAGQAGAASAIFVTKASLPPRLAPCNGAATG